MLTVHFDIRVAFLYGIILMVVGTQFSIAVVFFAAYVTLYLLSGCILCGQTTLCSSYPFRD